MIMERSKGGRRLSEYTNNSFSAKAKINSTMNLLNDRALADRVDHLRTEYSTDACIRETWTMTKKLVLSALVSPREMLSKVAQKGNQGLLCCTLLAAKRRSRRDGTAHAPVSSLIFLDRAGETAVAHNRLARRIELDSWDLQISK